MKVLITGADGQLGQALGQINSEKSDLTLLTQEECDITQLQQLQTAFERILPDAVIHCAAYTAVDRAESEPEICNYINIFGTENVAKMCGKYNSALMLLSTDYVFGDSSNRPYEINDVRFPLNHYGFSKMIAENIVLKLDKSFVVRTSWMFGNGRNFVRTICELARKNDIISVVDDQIGSPTYSEDLAPLLIKIVENGKYGIYHATNEGLCSWAELAEASLRLMGINAHVKRVSSDEYNSAARRPHNSRLSKKTLDDAGFLRLPEWGNALERYIRKYGVEL